MGSGRWALWILFKIKIIYYISKLNKCIIAVSATTGEAPLEIWHLAYLVGHMQAENSS